MKNFIVLFVLAFSVLITKAQDSKVVSAYNYRKPQYYQLDKAKLAIDEASVHEKTIANPKTWYYRGLVYQDLAVTTDANFKTLHSNPLDEATKSYLKSLSLDVKNKFRNEVILQLTQMSVLLINKGIEEFNNSAFDKALQCFENSLKIDSVPELAKTDSMVIYNAGVAADKAKNFEKALFYYKKAIDLKYEGSKVYIFVSNVYKEMKDTAQALETLKTGISAEPKDNGALMVELINYYLNSNKTDEALSYLNLAIQNDPSNFSYYFAQGTLYDKMGDFDNARTRYEKALELKSDYFDACYNLGALFYNKAVLFYKEANDIPPKEQKRYDETIAKAKEQLNFSMPHLEKAHSLNPNDVFTLQSLKEIYTRLAMYDKAKEIKEKLDTIK